MANGKKSVLLYCDLIHTVDPLTDEEAGRLFKHYLSYINDLNPEPIDRLTGLLFEPIKQNLKRDLVKWESKSLKNSENAKLRWDKKNANACERIESNANYADKVTVTVTDNVIDKDINLNKFNFKNSLLDLGIELNIVETFLSVRKKKKSVNSELAFTKIKNEITKSGLTPNEAIKIAAEKSWSGFEADWINKSQTQPQQPIQPQIKYERF